MRTSKYLLALWLFAAPAALRAEELPVVFARSGQKVTLSVASGGAKSPESVALWTFGQPLGEAAAVRNGVAEFVTPAVRAPLVARLAPAKGTKTVLAELVVYPDRPPVRWDKDTQLVAAGTPDWFDTWSQTVGLPVQKLKDLKTLDAGHWRMLEKPGLLVLGREAAGIASAVACRLAGEHKINVLVLDSDWFGRNRTVSRDVAILPRDMAGALAALQTQQWPTSLNFEQRAVRVTSRQTWIVGPEHALVEEIRGPQRGSESLRTVFSYLPWQRQLGRREIADDLFLRLLTETAKGAKDRPALDGRWVLLYPTAKEISLVERPVLAAAMKAAETDGEEAESRTICAYVLDLRGKAAPPADLFDGTGDIRKIEARIGIESPLLILGDSPVLDTWKWLELDRAHHRSPRPGVVWCSDSSLPPSLDSQLRLMQLFTEWNIPLEDTSGE